ncbi:hypothetical protein HK101_007401 [Irineochytrium annulatum]|nr:hypothetical protein HK101_007401 [Irineochytrium annulatum]
MPTLDYEYSGAGQDTEEDFQRRLQRFARTVTQSRSKASGVSQMGATTPRRSNIGPDPKYDPSLPISRRLSRSGVWYRPRMPEPETRPGHSRLVKGLLDAIDVATRLKDGNLLTNEELESAIEALLSFRTSSALSSEGKTAVDAIKALLVTARDVLREKNPDGALQRFLMHAARAGKGHVVGELLETKELVKGSPEYLALVGKALFKSEELQAVLKNVTEVTWELAKTVVGPEVQRRIKASAEHVQTIAEDKAVELGIPPIIVEPVKTIAMGITSVEVPEERTADSKMATAAETGQRVESTGRRTSPAPGDLSSAAATSGAATGASTTGGAATRTQAAPAAEESPSWGGNGYADLQWETGETLPDNTWGVEQGGIGTGDGGNGTTEPVVEGGDVQPIPVHEGDESRSRQASFSAGPYGGPQTVPAGLGLDESSRRPSAVGVDQGFGPSSIGRTGDMALAEGRDEQKVSSPRALSGAGARSLEMEIQQLRQEVEMLRAEKGKSTARSEHERLAGKQPATAVGTGMAAGTGTSGAMTGGAAALTAGGTERKGEEVTLTPAMQKALRVIDSSLSLTKEPMREKLAKLSPETAQQDLQRVTNRFVSVFRKLHQPESDETRRAMIGIVDMTQRLRPKFNDVLGRYDVDYDLQLAFREFRTLLQRFANGQSMQTAINAYNAMMERVTSRADLTILVDDFMTLIRRALADRRYVEHKDMPLRIKSLIRRLNEELKAEDAGVTTAFHTMMDEWINFVKGFAQDETNKRLRQRIKSVTQALFMDMAGRPTLKVGFIKDFVYVVFPMLWRELDVIPIQRIEYISPEMDVVVEDIVIKTSEIIPSAMEVHMINAALVGMRREYEGFELSNTMVITMHQINTTLRDMPFYYKKKKGMAKTDDRGVASVYIGGKGITVTIELALNVESPDTTLSPQAVVVNVDEVQTEVIGSKNDQFYKTFQPTLNNMLKNEISNGIGSRLVKLVTEMDKKLTDTKLKWAEQARISAMEYDEPGRRSEKIAGIAGYMKGAREKAGEAKESMTGGVMGKLGQEVRSMLSL